VRATSARQDRRTKSAPGWGRDRRRSSERNGAAAAFCGERTPSSGAPRHLLPFGRRKAEVQTHLDGIGARGSGGSFVIVAIATTAGRSVPRVSGAIVAARSAR
jgi:hypothetical protein